MDFTMSRRAEDLSATVRRFIDEVVIPYEAREDSDHLPDELISEMRQKARDWGIYTPHLPVELGGQGLSHVETAAVFMAAGRSLLGPVALNCAAPDEGNMHLLWKTANDEQKGRYLRPLVEGKFRSCFGMTEPAQGVGADASMVKSTAVRDGDEWVLNGHKWFTTGAMGAGFCIFAAVTNPKVKAHEGVSLFLVPMNTPGFTVKRMVPVLGTHGPGGHCEMVIENVRVSQSAMLGKEGEGFKLMQVRLGPARLTHCMRWIGAAERALDLMAHRALEREAFKVKLADHQNTQWSVADSVMDLHTAKLVTLHAAWLLDQGSEAREETSMAKLYASEAVNRVFDRAVQVMGGLGYSGDTPVERFFREGRAFRIYDGPSEVHRMVIARNFFRQIAKNPPKVNWVRF